jgi:hypothetical protein
MTKEEALEIIIDAARQFAQDLEDDNGENSEANEIWDAITTLENVA